MTINYPHETGSFRQPWILVGTYAMARRLRSLAETHLPPKTEILPRKVFHLRGREQVIVYQGYGYSERGTKCPGYVLQQFAKGILYAS